MLALSPGISILNSGTESISFDILCWIVSLFFLIRRRWIRHSKAAPVDTQTTQQISTLTNIRVKMTEECTDEIVTDSVRIEEGDSVGSVVGVIVGSVVGFAVGSIVVFLEGFIVGSEDGSRFGG